VNSSGLGLVVLGYGPSVQAVFSAPGSYAVHLTYRDAYNQNQTAASVRVNAFPAVTTAPLVPPTDVGVPATFSASANQGTGADRFIWDFRDGGNATGPSVRHTFGSPGGYSVLVTVVDAVGGWSTAVESIDINPPVEVAVATVGSPAQVGKNVTFLASPSGGTAPLRASWTFGDGGSGQGPFVTHSFATAGSHRVLVQISDAVGGSANGSLTVAVSAATPTPSPTPTNPANAEPLPWLAAGALLASGVLLGVALTAVVVVRKRLRKSR
jgi:PKD repeat protein